MFSPSRRIVAGLNRLSEVLCVLLLAVLVVISGLQVFFRYVLQEPLIWSEEAARYLLIWLSFAAGGLVLRDNGHPRIEAISALVTPRMQALIDLVLQALIAIFLAVFIWVSWGLALRYIQFTSLGTGISQAVPRFALPVGGLLLLINLGPLVAANIGRVRGDDVRP